MSHADFDRFLEAWRWKAIQANADPNDFASMLDVLRDEFAFLTGPTQALDDLNAACQAETKAAEIAATQAHLDALQGE